MIGRARDARIRCNHLQHAGKIHLGRNSAACGAAMTQLHSRDDPLIKEGERKREREKTTNLEEGLVGEY